MKKNNIIIKNTSFYYNEINSLLHTRVATRYKIPLCSFDYSDLNDRQVYLTKRLLAPVMNLCLLWFLNYFIICHRTNKVKYSY